MIVEPEPAMALSCTRDGEVDGGGATWGRTSGDGRKSPIALQLRAPDGRIDPSPR
jgi:hypothetical protein